MLPYSIVAGGTYTNPSTAIPVNIPLTDYPDFVWVRNRTDWGDTTAVTSIESNWWKGMAQGAFQSKDQAVTTNILSSNVGTSNGFTFFNTVDGISYAALTNGTTINGTTWVCSINPTTNLFPGDIVRLYNTTGMHQIGGYDFQISAVSTNVSFTLGMVASSGITAVNASAFYVLKIIQNKFYPRWRYIANITQAAQAVVYFTVANDFTIGEIVSFRVSSDYGMDEINNVAARVISVTNSSTVSSITLDLDTSGFTAFTLPTTAVADSGISPAVCVPSSSGVVPVAGSTTVQQPPGTNLLDAFDNRNQYLMQLGTSVVGANSAVMDYLALKYDLYTTN